MNAATVERELPRGWAQAPFAELFENVTSSKLKLKERGYESSGLFPVVDQGEETIGGFTDDESLVHPGPLPVIVFGDHTRCVKLMTRPFVQGADGVKILAPNPNLSPWYLYWAMRAMPVPSRGYARHFSLLRATGYPVAPVREQHRIVEALDSYFTRLDAAQVALEHGQTSLKRYRRIEALRAAILRAAFEGRLADQDSTDEPAKALLARIRTNHAESRPAPTGRRRQTP